VGATSYEIVIAWVEAGIRAGRYKPGDRLPTIHELADLTDTNPTAVKTALLLLRERGVTRSQQGKGTYVADRV
jgi:GntR family transcriptional repressor for pyruvate dehydrogenase complex